jgi:hypothetical protein
MTPLQVFVAGQCRKAGDRWTPASGEAAHRRRRAISAEHPDAFLLGTLEKTQELFEQHLSFASA